MWKDIQDFEGLYQVNDQGEVLNVQTKKLLTPDRHYRGYLRVRLFKKGVVKNCFLHRVVATAFLPNPEEKDYVNHKDRNKQNNCVKNLEWATPGENSAHYIQDDRMRIESAASLIPF